MKKFFLAFVGISFLVFAGFGCKNQKPEQVLQEMTNQLADSFTAAFAVSGTADVSAADGKAASEMQSVFPGATEISFLFSGSGSSEEEGNLEQQSTFSLNVNGQNPLTIAGEMRMKDQKTYFNFSQLELPSELASFIDANKLVNRWIEAENVSPSMMEDAMMQENEGDTLSEEDLKAMKAALRDASIFAEQNEEGNENLRGTDTLRYAVVFDVEGVVDLMREFAQISGEEFTQEDEMDLRSFVASLNDGNPTVWVGKDDHKLRQFSFSTVLEDEEGSLPLDLKLELYDYGVETVVEIPSDTVSLESLMEEMLGGFLGSMMFGGMMDDSSPSMEESTFNMEDFESQMQEFEDAMKELEAQFGQ